MSFDFENSAQIHGAATLTVLFHGHPAKEFAGPRTKLSQVTPLVTSRPVRVALNVLKLIGTASLR